MLRKALLLCLLASAPALAQGDGELPVNIVVVKPRTVYLVPGGETKSIRLQGLGFEPDPSGAAINR